MKSYLCSILESARQFARGFSESSTGWGWKVGFTGVCVLGGTLAVNWSDMREAVAGEKPTVETRKAIWRGASDPLPSNVSAPASSPEGYPQVHLPPTGLPVPNYNTPRLPPTGLPVPPSPNGLRGNQAQMREEQQSRHSSQKISRTLTTDNLSMVSPVPDALSLPTSMPTTKREQIPPPPPNYQGMPEGISSPNLETPHPQMTFPPMDQPRPPHVAVSNPPAWRWYGWGATMPGGNPLAPNGIYPQATAAWLHHTSTTQGAIPLPSTPPFHPIPLTEAPSYHYPPQNQDWIIRNYQLDPKPDDNGGILGPPRKLDKDQEKKDDKKDNKDNKNGIEDKNGKQNSPEMLDSPPARIPLVPKSSRENPAIGPALPQGKNEIRFDLVPPPLPVPPMQWSSIGTNAPPSVNQPMMRASTPPQPILNPPVSTVRPAKYEEPVREEARPPAKNPPLVQLLPPVTHTPRSSSLPIPNQGANVQNQPIIRGQSPETTFEVPLHLHRWLTQYLTRYATNVNVIMSGEKRMAIRFHATSEQTAQSLVKHLTAAPELAAYHVDFEVEIDR